VPPLAIKVVLGVVQFNAKLPVMLAVGAVLSNVVVTLALDVHPFEPVTVTVNVEPVVITPDEASVEPLLHKYVPPPLAIKVVFGVVQFNAKFPVMLAVGAVLSKVVETLALDVQPFALVTVTVNIAPVVITPDEASVEPLLHE
jgi:hypothetical protein